MKNRLQPLLVQALVRVDLGVDALEVERRQHAGRAMAGPRHEEDVQAPRADDAVQVRVDERQRGARAPVPEQPALHVLGAERLAQERVVPQVDHSEREVVAGAPEGVEPLQLLRRERRALHGGAGRTEGGQAGGSLQARCARRHGFSSPSACVASRQQRASVARDHQLLVGVDHPRRDPAPRGADARAARGVGRRVELHAEPAGIAADALADLGRVLADAGGEDDGVEPPERRRQRPQLAADPVDEEVHREPRAGLGRGEQRAHVARDPRDAEQPRLVVEEALDSAGVEPALVGEPEHDAGVERAAARPHAEAVEHAEAHGRRDALALEQGAEAGAVSQVHRHGPSARGGGVERREHRRDVLVGEPVEAVAPDARLVQLLGEREALGHGRHAAMEGGVEAGHLRQRRIELAQGADGARLCGWCSGASGTNVWRRASTASSTSTGASNDAPPCTTR